MPRPCPPDGYDDDPRRLWVPPLMQDVLLALSSGLIGFMGGCWATLIVLARTQDEPPGPAARDGRG